MKFRETPLAGSYLIDLEVREDERGFFARYFCKKEFEKNGLNTQWLQINNSMSNDIGTLRGLHFQRSPSAEIKLVRCIAGEIFDVIVDIRNGSATYGQWFGEKLNASNRTMMYVPKGFAHGFITLEPYSEIIYLVSEYYDADAEDSLYWADPSVNINWPLTPNIISERDRLGKSLSQIKKYDMEFKI